MPWFSNDLFLFLADLAEHNDRVWFQANKASYDKHVKQASLRFIDELAPALSVIAPQIRCDERALFRIYRDTRFSKDKSPYKVHVGLHFRHGHAGDVHAPGYYLHLANDGCFFGCGIWQPDPPTLARLRQRMLDDVAGWSEVVATVRDLRWEADSLVRPPRGVAVDHPHVEHLKRRSIVVVGDVSREEVLREELVGRFADRCRVTAPLMADLCATLGLPW